MPLIVAFLSLFAVMIGSIVCAVGYSIWTLIEGIGHHNRNRRKPSYHVQQTIDGKEQQLTPTEIRELLESLGIRMKP